MKINEKEAGNGRIIKLKAPKTEPHFSNQVFLNVWQSREEEKDEAVWPDWAIFESSWQQIVFYK